MQLPWTQVHETLQVHAETRMLRSLELLHDTARQATRATHIAQKISRE